MLETHHHSGEVQVTPSPMAGLPCLPFMSQMSLPLFPAAPVPAPGPRRDPSTSEPSFRSRWPLQRPGLRCSIPGQNTPRPATALLDLSRDYLNTPDVTGNNELMYHWPFKLYQGLNWLRKKILWEMYRFPEHMANACFLWALLSFPVYGSIRSDQRHLVIRQTSIALTLCSEQTSCGCVYTWAGR